MESNTISIGVEIRPYDPRCRYWAKIVQRGTPLPAPNNVNSAGDIPGEYLRKGDEELAPGDFLFEGEENHHRKARGWSYWVSFIDPESKKKRCVRPKAGHKESFREQGMDVSLLRGSGGIAACVRIAHAVRLEMNVPRITGG